MAVGLSAANLVNNWLNMLAGIAFTGPSSLYVATHYGDPGGAGTANPGGDPTRKALTLATPASGGTIAMTGTVPSWTITYSGTLTHISVWDSLTGGNFLWSAQLGSPTTVTNGDTFRLSACGISFNALAA